MTVFIASLFLPYTVHFEVQSTNDGALEQNASLGDIAQPIKQNARHALDSNPVVKKRIPTDSTMSIIQALSNNQSASNLLSDDELINVPPATATVGIINDKQSSSSVADALGSTSFNIDVDDLSVSTLDTELTNAHNVSVQEFFFNNPNYRKSSMNSHGDLSSSQLDDPLSSKRMAINLSGFQVSNTPTSTFIQPKQIKLQGSSFSVSSSVSEKLNPSLESTLSSMKVSRSGFFNTRRSTAHSANPKRPPFLKTQSLSGYESNQITGDIDSTSGFAAFDYDLLMDDSAAFGDDNNRVTPFGGFSRPDYKDLLMKNNVFATAPWKVVEYDQGNGSLKNAVRIARLSKQVDSVMWIGTLSMPSDVVPELTKTKITTELQKKYYSTPVYVPDDVFQGHYTSFSKQILWPIFHYQIPDNPKSNAFENHSWKDYEAVNKSFADSIIAQYKTGDIVWVHDYHLMLVPKIIREKLPQAKIGFFLHVSFPSSEVFRCLAQRVNILEGLLGADCICFQTEEYVRHFLQSCNRLLLADFDEDGVKYKNRIISVTHNSIGIDSAHLSERLHTEDVADWRRLVRERWPQRKLIVSRDKIDKIRGVKEKLLAYERFLDDNPEYLSEALLILICPRSRSDVDEDFETEVFEIVERVNSKTNNISDDQPIALLNQDIEFEQYLALLSEADLFIVSTLREGMNLTSHEFIVAAQESHSPLILSEFIGSAHVLNKGPLVANPYNIKQVAEMIRIGLEMDPVEKLNRWRSMYKVVVEHDSKSWINDCIRDIENGVSINQKERSSDMTKLTQELLDSKYNQLEPSKKRLFVLNLGNLTSTVEVQGSRINPVQQQFMNNTIANLASDPNNIVYILSFLKRSDLLRKYRRINELGLISENGGYIKLPHKSDWYTVIDETELGWMPTVIDMMKSFAERLPSSYVEVEECTVRFHTESCSDIDRDHKLKLIGELITHINELYAKDFNLHANLVNGIIVVQEANLILRALSFLMNQNSFDGPLRMVSSSTLTSPLSHPPTSASTTSTSLDSQLSQFRDSLGFVLVAGGSTPVDEEIFHYFNNLDCIENRLTIKVGQDTFNSKAGETLRGINELLIILSKAIAK